MHKSAWSLWFYSKASPCLLPINCLIAVLKPAKISGHLLLCDSQDPLVANSIPQLKTSSHHEEEAVAITESVAKNNFWSSSIWMQGPRLFPWS